MLGSSVTPPEWIEAIPAAPRRSLVLAEGLFMYLTEEEILTLLRRLKARLGSYTLVFDAFSLTTAKYARFQPALRKTGAQIRWGINEPAVLAAIEPSLCFVREIYFTSKEATERLSPGNRFRFRLANKIPAARRAHRLLVYELG
jgi:O-methyltransferase involved in polyketide biosynthesis